MSDKYKELLDAVHALDPFSADFNTANSINSKKPECNYHCKICGADVINVKHDNDCPVVKIRNILTEALPASCLHNNGEHEVMITMEAVKQKSYGLAPLKQEGECADPLMFTIDN